MEHSALTHLCKQYIGESVRCDFYGEDAEHSNLWCNRASGQYLFNFHSWHSKLLPAAHAARDNFSDKDSAAVPVTAED